ncbi:MAG: hypothetical protein H0X40_11155 [Chthoniobacterales bacterium]|nr:hypothetical protein [Chthoniobacterales bacterium]
MRFRLLFLLCTALAVARADEPVLDAEAQREQAVHEKDLQRNPSSAAAHFSYAEFYSNHGQLRPAITHWRFAQLLDPTNAAVANSLGGAYLHMGRAAQSAEQFQRAINCAGAVAAYHYNLGNVEFLLRHDLTAAWQINDDTLLHRALAEFRAASRLSPNDMEYARSYAETFYGVPNADWVEADAAWKHVLELSPQGDFAYLQLARVSLKRGDKMQARQFLDQIRNSQHDSLKQKLRDQADKL